MYRQQTSSIGDHHQCPYYEKMKDLEYSVKAEHRDVDRDGQRKSSQMR